MQKAEVYNFKEQSSHFAYSLEITRLYPEKTKQGVRNNIKDNFDSLKARVIISSTAKGFRNRPNLEQLPVSESHQRVTHKVTNCQTKREGNPLSRELKGLVVSSCK